VLTVWSLKGDDEWISELSTHGPFVDPFVIVLEHPHCQRIIVYAPVVNIMQTPLRFTDEGDVR
jgi:hypothetical protein